MAGVCGRRRSPEAVAHGRRRQRRASGQAADNGVVIRLVATDLDGTFRDADLLPPDAHLAAVDALVDAGVTVLAAASRRPRVVKRQFDRVGLSMPAVLIDGALGVDFRTGVRFHQACFNPDLARRTLAMFRAHELDPCVYVEHPEFDIMVSSTPSTCPAHLAYLGAVAATGDLKSAAATMSVYAFAVLGLALERLEPVAGALALAGTSNPVLYREPDYGQFGLIVSPQGISKWSGVRAYCDRNGIGPEEVLAVGDGLNDVTVLQAAGVAVAVRGGAEAAMAASDHLIDPPAEHGWAGVVDLVQAVG
jgi:hydroxymethylpyrimidine pyrophosphatase-like HAD family hydrolase